MAEPSTEIAASAQRPAQAGAWRRLDGQTAALVAVLALGLILRLALATLPGFEFDLGLFRSWSERLASEPPWDFYDVNPVPNYTPGYLYVLWALGELRQTFGFGVSEFEYVLKLPAIAGDLGAAYFLYALLQQSRPGIRIGAVAFYLAFPPVLFVGAVWGHMDSLVALPLLASVYFISRGRPMAGAICFTLAFMVKPLAISALPFLTVWIVRRHPPVEWARITVVSFAVALLVILPFFSYRVWEFVEHLDMVSNVDGANSVYAYNFWQMFGFWEVAYRGDSMTEYGLATRYWGIILYGGTVLATVAVTWRRDSTGALALGTALSVLAFFVFVTRMHERYVFSFFVLCLVAAALQRNRVLLFTLCGLGAINFANLYWSYGFYNYKSWLVINEVYAWLLDSDAFWLKSILWFPLGTSQLLSVPMVAAVPVLLVTAFFTHDRQPSLVHGQNETGPTGSSNSNPAGSIVAG